MTVLATDTRRATQRNVERAMSRHGVLTREGIRERAFAALFSGLVYAQIWEDPDIDMEALALKTNDHVVTIASGGCNVLSYLTADPAHITAIDLNAHHVALLKLKLLAARLIEEHAVFYRLFGEAKTRDNLEIYSQLLEPHLDAETRAYWRARTVGGHHRITLFARNLYRHGLLGRFISLGHVVARLHGKNPARLLEARSVAEQRALFESELRPVLSSPLVRWLASNPASLYGLGIPPAQYRALLSSAKPGEGMVSVLSQRLERLATGFDFKDNYFARQAFGRTYGPEGSGKVPPYLMAEHHDAIRNRTGRVDVRHENLVDFLAAKPDRSLDAYVLLDAQDWMTDESLGLLWRQITRTARPGARVIFRTAAEESVLPGRINPGLLAQWHYDAARCRAWTARDRSAIYGGFHLYTLADA